MTQLLKDGPYNSRGAPASVVVGIDPTSTYQVLKTDSYGTLSTKSIDTSHSAIHDGDHYVSNYNSTLSSGASINFAVITSTKSCHFTFSAVSDGKATVYLYELADTTTSGTSVPIFNSNRQSSNATTIAVKSAPTGGTLGSPLFIGMLGSSTKVGGGSRNDEELILKQNTTYVVRITAGANVEYVVRCSWYEK